MSKTSRPSRFFAHFSVILALALVAPAARAAVDAFIWFENAGIPGESKDPKHLGWIEVESYQLDQFRNAAIGSATGGAGAGKVSFHDITIRKTTDKASPLLAKASALGRHFPTVTLSVRKAGGNQQDFLKFELENVLISSYQTGRSSGGGGATPTETLTLNFQSVKWEYTPQHTPTPGSRVVQVAPGAAGIVNLTPTITKVTPSAASATTGQALTFAVEGTGDCARSRIDFGDGTVVDFPFTAGKAQPAPTHTYSKGGTFEVRAYGLADPWAKLPAPPQASEHVCSGHASASVTIHLPLSPAVAPAVRR